MNRLASLVSVALAALVLAPAPALAQSSLDEPVDGERPRVGQEDADGVVDATTWAAHWVRAARFASRKAMRTN